MAGMMTTAPTASMVMLYFVVKVLLRSGFELAQTNFTAKIIVLSFVLGMLF
jgi:hypothetical protein